MKIVVLAGGLSTERLVALTSGTGVCRALRERGHKAILVDMFLGLENYEGRLEDIFDAPDGLCPDNRVESAAPDLEACLLYTSCSHRLNFCSGTPSCAAYAFCVKPCRWRMALICAP